MALGVMFEFRWRLHTHVNARGFAAICFDLFNSLVPRVSACRGRGIGRVVTCLALPSGPHKAHRRPNRGANRREQDKYENDSFGHRFPDANRSHHYSDQWADFVDCKYFAIARPELIVDLCCGRAVSLLQLIYPLRRRNPPHLKCIAHRFKALVITLRKVAITFLLVSGVLLIPSESWAQRRRDRKSTRLNSSHSQISYAVFCLKKKKR